MKFVTTREAAEICGVSTVTIQKLVREGVFTYKTTGKMYKISESEVRKYSEKIGKIHKATKKVDDYLAECEKLAEKVDEKRREAETALDNIGILPRRVYAMEWLLNKFLSIYKKEFSEDELYAIDCYLQGKFSAALEERYGYSVYKARKTYHGALRKVCEIKSRENALSERIEALEKENSELILGEGEEICENAREMMGVKIADCATVRLANVCKANDIVTIADLAQKTRTEILQMRNFGRKAFCEAEMLLEQMGLGFGMTKKEIIKHYTT